MLSVYLLTFISYFGVAVKDGKGGRFFPLAEEGRNPPLQKHYRE